MKNILRLCLLLSFVVVLTVPTQAQRGLGIKFGSDFNYFFRADEQPLVDGWWSHLVFGPYYQAYFEDGGGQAGINILYKGNTGSGFPNFPVIQRDLTSDTTQNIGLTGIEFDFKAGPRFGILNPKIGLLVSYWFKRDGFLEPGFTDQLNNVNVQFPIGLTIEGPTGYGSVGFGVFYEVGLSNVIRDPDPNGLQDFNGSRVRAVNVELHVLFAGGKQERRRLEPDMPPPPPLED